MRRADTLWTDLRDLFEHNDGSLPDIYVEDLQPNEIVSIYAWVMNLTTIYDSPNLWSKKEMRDVPIKDVQYPVEMYLSGGCDPFRHGLTEFQIDGVKIPQLTICIESEHSLSFDYRMGKDWGPQELEALFKFLCSIKRIASRAHIFQSWEGGHESPNEKFENALSEYCQSYPC